MLLTVGSIFVIGSTFYEFESSCEIIEEQKSCKETRSWKGASLSVISSFIGTSLNLYLAFKSGQPVATNNDQLPPQE